MPRSTLLTPLVLLIVVLPMAGCFYSREIAHTRRDLERSYPDAEFDREVVVSLGPVALRTLGWVSGLVPDEDVDMARAYLREISRVKVGVYNVEYLPSLDGFDPPSLRRFRNDGWEVAVKVQDAEGMVWVLYRENRDDVRDLYVIVLDDEDLVLARVKGHLNRLLARVMEDHYEMRDWVDGL